MTASAIDGISSRDTTAIRRFSRFLSTPAFSEGRWRSHRLDRQCRYWLVSPWHGGCGWAVNAEGLYAAALCLHSYRATSCIVQQASPAVLSLCNIPPIYPIPRVPSSVPRPCILHSSRCPRRSHRVDRFCDLLHNLAIVPTLSLPPPLSIRVHITPHQRIPGNTPTA